MNVPQEVMNILDGAELEGNALRLTGQLDRPLYAATNKVLEAAGGKWNRKAKAHLFEGEAADAIEQILLTGAVVNRMQELGAFYTPPSLADEIIEMANLEPGLEVLEPSAGRAALAAPALLADCVVDCIEIDDRSVHILCSYPFRKVVHGNFLEIPSEPNYDRVVMNPPFARQPDIDHVTHATEFLRPGGVLVAIMSASPWFRSNRKAVAFRELMESMGAEWRDLPSGSFVEAGTGVNTSVVRLRRGE